MITEKDIQTRTAEILMNAGFNVVASEVDEGFLKPAVFFSAYRSRRQQIYSLPPLAARELSQTMRDKPESLSLFMELVMGLEPATC